MSSEKNIKDARERGKVLPGLHQLDMDQRGFASPVEHVLFMGSTTLYPIEDIHAMIREIVASSSRRGDIVRREEHLAKLCTILAMHPDSAGAYEADNSEPIVISDVRHNAYVQGVLPLFNVMELRKRGLVPRVYLSPMDDSRTGKTIPSWRVTVVRTRDENGNALAIDDPRRKEVPEELDNLHILSSHAFIDNIVLYPQDTKAKEEFRLLEIKENLTPEDQIVRLIWYVEDKYFGDYQAEARP